MSAALLLDELADAGIRLAPDGADLLAETRPGASLEPYRHRNRAHKPAILAALRLQDQIVAAATAATDAFDRAHYDALWQQWHALQDQESIP
jgi:hypothetical protein